jgi:hypothetical protein
MIIVNSIIFILNIHFKELKISRTQVETDSSERKYEIEENSVHLKDVRKRGKRTMRRK